MCNCNDLPEVLNGTSPKMVTERNAALREQNAFISGAYWGTAVYPYGHVTEAPTAAKIRYPLPKVKRQRIVMVAGAINVRYNDGTFEWDDGVCWRTLEGGFNKLSSEELRMLADLKETPYEEVDA